MITSVAAVLACWGFFERPGSGGTGGGRGVPARLVPRLRVPAALLPLLGTLAASSLFVYLTHWQVYPHLEMDHPMLATLASVAVGVVVWRIHGELAALTTRGFRSIKGDRRQAVRIRALTAGVASRVRVDGQGHGKRPHHPPGQAV